MKAEAIATLANFVWRSDQDSAEFRRLSYVTRRGIAVARVRDSMTSTPNDVQGGADPRATTEDSSRYWRRLLHRWLIEYNPLYLLSAMLVLGGMILTSQGLARQSSLYGPLGVAAIAELYALALIGGAALCSCSISPPPPLSRSLFGRSAFVWRLRRWPPRRCTSSFRHASSALLPRAADRTGPRCHLCEPVSCSPISTGRSVTHPAGLHPKRPPSGCRLGSSVSAAPTTVDSARPKHRTLRHIRTFRRPRAPSVRKAAPL